MGAAIKAPMKVTGADTSRPLAGWRFAPVLAPARLLALLTALLCAAGLSVMTPAGTALAAYPGRDGLIAFVRDGNIYTINPAHPTTAPVRLTTGGHASGPRWSPNGARIAYVDSGNLWVMRANGSAKKRLTNAAPRYTDSRPSWSPNGKYLAFVQTRRGHSYGYLDRYNLAGHNVRHFTTTLNGKLRQVAALPAPVAWTWTPTSSTENGSFIAYEGAAALCAYPHRYCLNLLGFDSQAKYRNGFPSAADVDTTFRLTDPDWYPIDPAFATQLMTTQETCTASHCTPEGLDQTITAAPTFAGAYEGVYSPTGALIAYVKGSGRHAHVYYASALAAPTKLVAGSQPDWQPLTAAAVN
jgi:Dipeptidyl peptidase IV (DPP IV) N-terminal region